MCHLLLHSACLPNTDVDLDAEEPLLTHIFPPPCSTLDWTVDSPCRYLSEGDGKIFFENHLAVLMLAHYLDCSRLLAQIEAVMMTRVVTRNSDKAPESGAPTVGCVGWSAQTSTAC